MKLLHTKKQAFYKGMNICSVRAQIESLKSFKIVYFGGLILRIFFFFNNDAKM